MPILAPRRLLLLALGLAAGCGREDGGEDARTLSPAEADTICDQTCDAAESCGEQRSACVIACLEKASLWRGDLMRFLADCLLAIDCDLVRACDAQAEKEFMPTSAARKFARSCDLRLEGCGFSDGVAAICDYSYLGDDVIEDLSACLDETCFEIEACLEIRAGA